jgi:DNA repair exonuclease SbcCD nuclease subunit
MKIVHVADLHIGYKAYNRLEKNGFNVREMDVLSAFQESLEKISKINPDLIIFAGDIFHKPRPSNFSLFVTIKFLQKFRTTCNSPIVIIGGNHELTKSTESGSVLNFFEAIIPNTKVVEKEIKEIAFNEINVVCVPYGAFAEIDKNTLKPNKDHKYNVLTLHGSYNSKKCPEISKNEHTALIEEDNINGSEWDYVALGHYHKFTELEKNIYYSGAIERTSTNIWQEAKDPKGFIEYNLAEKQVKFHALERPRKVYDTTRINAESLTAEEINLKIEEEVAKIKDFETSIVRVTIENIDPLAVRNLNYQKIREYRKKAVHFMLNLIKKDQNLTFEEGETCVSRRKNLQEALEEELNGFELAQGLNLEKFGSLAKEYFKAAAV